MKILLVAMATLITIASAHAQTVATGQQALREKDIEFAGYAMIGQDELFVLYDGGTKSASPWMRAGQTWEGYTIISFDRHADSLILGNGKMDRTLKLRASKTQPTVLLPALTRGAYTLLDGTVIYSPDAQLRLGGGVLLSSPSGLMVSDENQTIVGGDLTVETGRTIIRAQGALVKAKNGEISAKQITITPAPKKESNQATNRTSPNVPAPPSQDPRR